MKNYETVVVLLAGGKGSRFLHKKPKQFIKVYGKTVLEYTLDVFDDIQEVSKIYLVCHKDYLNKCKKLMNKYQKIESCIIGGETRGESIKNGVEYIQDFPIKKVIIHDSVRPLISKTVIKNIIKSLDKYHFVQTVSESHDDFVIDNSFCNRSKIKICSGPEGALLSVLKTSYSADAHNSVMESVISLPDIKFCTIESNPENIKITHPQDIFYFKSKLKHN